MAETALVMSVLLALLFGIVEFGRVMYTYAFVAQLARQGARWAIVRGSQCTVLDSCNAETAQVQTYVDSLTYGATNNGNMAVTTTWPGTDCPPNASALNAPGCLVIVNVSYKFAFIAPFVSKATLQLSSTSQMVISQ
jgi:Flp pilus assembly protein TadG